MSAAEKPPNLEELDPRYPLLAGYLERDWVLIRLWGVAEASTAENPICLCNPGGPCKAGKAYGKHPNGTYKETNGTAYVRTLEEAVQKLPPGKRWNVGLAFGYGAGAEYIALDMESDAALERIRSEYGFDPLEACAWDTTGRGYHSLYKLTPEQLENREALGMMQGAGAWAVPEVDVRVGGTNGLIAIEPSIHYTGRAYKWQALEEPGYAPEGFLELMATHEKLRKHERPAPPSKSGPPVIASSSSVFEDLNRKRAEKLLESLCSKVTSAPTRRNDAVKDAAYAAGAALCEWPEHEQAEYRERLKEAAAVHTPPGDPDYAGRRHTVDESWKAGAKAGGQRVGREDGPIPPPGSEPRPKSSSTSSSSSSEEPEKDAFTPRVVLTRLSDLGPPLPVEWLPSAIADRRIPLGELSIIMGVPGIGKGSITAQIVAELTQAGHAVIVSAPEDDLHRVTLPRYMAAGADIEKVYAIAFEWAAGEQGPVSIGQHYTQLLKVAGDVGAVAIILDPYEEHLHADVKNEQANREALRPLLSGAREQRVAVLGIDHPNRGTATDAYLRAGGNSAKYKLARSVLIAARQAPSDPSASSVEASSSSELVLIHAKSNLGKLAAGLRFAVHTEVVIGEGGAPVETARAELIGETTLTAEEVLGEGAQEQAASVAAAAEWLEAFLTEHGLGMVAEEVEKAAKALNDEWTRAVLKLAVKRLGGKYAALGMGGRWGYRLEGYKPLGEDRP